MWREGNWVGIGIRVRDQGRMSVNLAQVNQARLGENSRNSNPGVA